MSNAPRLATSPSQDTTPSVQLVDGSAVPLVAWVALDSGRLYGVSLGENGRVDLADGDAEKIDGFAGYRQANTTDKENENG